MIIKSDTIYLEFRNKKTIFHLIEIIELKSFSVNNSETVKSLKEKSNKQSLVLMMIL